MPRDRSLIFLFRPSPNRLRYASNRLCPTAVHWAACPFHRVDRHVFDEIAAVEHYAQLLFGPLLIGHRVKAEHFDSSRVSRGHIEDQFDQRGFAGAVRTNQTHDVAGRQVEGHVIQCEAGIIMLRHSRPRLSAFLGGVRNRS